jgi:hypothetical protein
MEAEMQMDEEATERLRQEERDAEFAARLQEEEEQLVREELRKSSAKKRQSRSDSAAAASVAAAKKPSKEPKDDSWVSRSDRKKSTATTSAQQKSFKRLRKVKDFETESEESDEEAWLPTDDSEAEADGEAHRSGSSNGRARPAASDLLDATNADTEDEDEEDDRDDFEPVKPSAPKRKQKESVSSSRSNPRRTRAAVDGPSAAMQRDSKVHPALHLHSLPMCGKLRDLLSGLLACSDGRTVCASDLWQCRFVRGAM